jgi:hypothetical protein
MPPRHVCFSFFFEYKMFDSTLIHTIELSGASDQSGRRSQERAKVESVKTIIIIQVSR